MCRDKHIMLISAYYAILKCYIFNPIMLLRQLLLCLHYAQKIHFTYKKNMTVRIELC